MANKECRVCGKVKGIEEFSVRDKGGGADGRENRCRKCYAGYMREWRKKNEMGREKVGVEVKSKQRGCRKCGVRKLLSEFPNGTGLSATGKVLFCKECNARSAKEWRRNNPEKREKHTREGFLKGQYDMTVEEYNEMLEAQGDGCAICGGVNSDGRSLAVDHCHETGLIRGILCTRCNMGLGYVGDDVKILRRMIGYLSRGDMTFSE